MKNICPCKCQETADLRAKLAAAEAMLEDHGWLKPVIERDAALARVKTLEAMDSAELKSVKAFADKVVAKLAAAEADHRKTMDLAAERLVLLDASTRAMSELFRDVASKPYMTMRDERDSLRAKLAAAEADAQADLETIEQVCGERDTAMARVRELEELHGNAVGNCGRLGLALTKAEARIADLEGALRECMRDLSLDGYENYRKTWERARRVLDASPGTGENPVTARGLEGDVTK